jgi:hypothetical protein
MGEMIDSGLRRTGPSHPGMRTIYLYALIFLFLSVASQNMVATAFPVSCTRDTPKIHRNSMACGKLRVEWFNPTADALVPGKSTLIVTGEGGVEILRVVEEAWMPPALEVLMNVSDPPPPGAPQNLHVWKGWWTISHESR